MAGMQQAAPAAKALHIFKPGRHITVAGEAIEFSEADIAAVQKGQASAPIGKPRAAADIPLQLP